MCMMHMRKGEGEDDYKSIKRKNQAFDYPAG